MKKHLLVLLFIVAGFSPVFAQADLGKGFKKDKAAIVTLARAEEYFEGQSYLQALPLYRSLEPTYGTNSFLIYRIGICLLYKSDETDKALEYLTNVKKQNPKAADIDLYLAHAYHRNERYDEAIANLDLYDASKAPARKEESARLRQYCLNAKELTANPVKAVITNIGAPVNTENSEYVPVISTDDSVMVLTYRGENSIGGLQSYPGVPDSAGSYFEDVVFTSRDGAKWLPPEAMDSTINGNGHDACIGISNDGQTLLIYKDEAGNGDLYVSTMEGFYWSAPVPLKGDINSTTSWEGSATFSADMHTIYFASERPGGYGGRDIWVATMAADSTWGNIKNMGPKINTPYNDDAPFLHPNGVTLLFSSEGHNSMGGYDIFKTILTPIDSTFSDASAPVNLGYPINTPGDDKYFVLATDGNHGYYSSGKRGGFGQQDIYVVEADFDLNNINVMLFNGTVMLNNKPVGAQIIVKDGAGKLRTLELYSKSYTGKYAVSLPLGHKYIVTYSADGVESQTRIIDSIQSPEMVTRTIDIQFFTQAFLDSTRMADSLAKIQRIIGDSIRNLHPTPGIANMDYNEALRTYGNAKSPGLTYHVQVAAYNFPKNYSSKHLQKFGKLDKRILDDKITRFTLGTFDTFAAAEAYRQEVIAAGQTDAFVTAEKEGKRYLIKELVELRFFQP
jgi:hypothetical protein